MKTSLKTALQPIALALAILLSPAGSYADGFLADDVYVDYDGYSSTLYDIRNGAGEVYVWGIRNKAATHITIPSTVVYEFTDGTDENGNTIVRHSTCRVTSISYFAFHSCTNLASVTIPDSVNYIGQDAFSGCTGLTSVTIPDSVTDIGINAFSGCSGLTSVAIPDSVTYIGQDAFSDCTGLTSVTIGDGVTIIGTEAFSDCRGLTNVTIGNSVTHIYYAAFSNCWSLTHVTIPDNVTGIGDCAFGHCRALASVAFEGAPPSGPMYGYGKGPFYNVATGARGYYKAEHAAKWKAVIGSDGKWEGLIMEEVGAPVADPPVLRVDSANPAEGSLTLAWDEPSTVEGVTYSVYRSANDTYAATDLVKDGLTETTWTDTNYWAAEPVLKPLNYWVVADGGGYGERVSEPVETRRRFGVFVGVGMYEMGKFRALTGNGWFDPSPDLSDIANAELFGKLAREEGGFTYVKVMAGIGAKKKAVREELQALAGKLKTGDYVALFFSSHGDLAFWQTIKEGSRRFSGIVMYDETYEKGELSSDLNKLLEGKNGVSVICVVNSCLSGGAVSASPANGHIAWITSCKETQLTPTWADTIGTPLPYYLLECGWNRGCAKKSSFLTFADLVDYTLPALKEFLKNVSKVNDPVIEETDVLKHFVAGRLGNKSRHDKAPDTPSNFAATTGGAEIQLSWSGDSTADFFLLGRVDLDESNARVYIKRGDSTSGKDPEAEWYGKKYRYYIAAMNEQGFSKWSKPVEGSRKNKVAQWVSDLFGFDDSTPVETLAAAAASASANGLSYQACYIVGIDPNDPLAAFEVELIREDEKWKAKPKGGEKEGRVYRVEGKKEMSDEEWTDVTDVEDLEAEGWRFFRVGVELAE